MKEKKALNNYLVEYDWGHKNITYVANEFLFSENFDKFIPKFIDDDDQFKLNFKDLDRSNVKFNSYGYRSDEFIKVHDKKHILFSGCSHTYGVGLSDSEMWSRKLYNKIKEQEDLSGYFNISNIGSSLIHQVLLLIKYCEEFGYPDYLVVGIPGIGRRYEFILEDLEYRQVINRVIEGVDLPELHKMRKDFELEMFLYYNFLNYLCKSNNIKLISFYHEFPTSYTPSILKHFDNFYDFNKDEFYSFLYEYQKSNPSDPYHLEARDGMHYGIAVNQFIYEKLINFYKESV